MAVKLIIFDFDGTIGDTYATIVEITNGLSAEFGYQPISETELDLLRNLSSRAIVKQAKISIFQIPFLLRRVEEELSQKMAQIDPIEGIEDCLIELKKRGYQLGIVTSNSQKNVHGFLEKNDLLPLFSFIYAKSSLFGKHKVINEIIRKKQLSRKEVVYVGDETRDISAAQKSRIKVISVAWGFNSSSVLAQSKPDFLIQQPQELIEVLEKLQPLQKVLSY